MEYTEQEIIKFKDKADKWDNLGKQIENQYINPETNEEWTEEELGDKEFDLCTIGELAATHFGWLM